MKVHDCPDPSAGGQDDTEFGLTAGIVTRSLAAGDGTAVVLHDVQLSAALDDRHADHERVRAALHAGEQEPAPAEMEHHIVGTVDVIRA